MNNTGSGRLPLLLTLMCVLLRSISLGQPAWHVEEVYTSSGTLYDVDIALDPDGGSHIVFGEGQSLWLADRIGGDWQASELFTGLALPNYVALSYFSSSGYPAVAYRVYQGYLDELYCSVWDGVEWSTDLIDYTVANPMPVMLTIDENDTPHLLYTETTMTNPPMDTHSWLHRARKPYQTWMIEDIMHLVSVYQGFITHFSFTFHPSGSGRAVLSRSYWDDYAYLHYLWPDSSEIWQLSYVEDEIDLGARMGLAIGPDALSRITFRRQQESWLHFAVGDSTGFEVEIVDSTCVCAKYNSISVDQTNISHICYSTPGALRYATGSYGSWTFTDIDPVSEGIIDVEIVMNGIDEPRIAWIDGNQVKYAWYGDSTSVAGTYGAVAPPVSMTVSPNPFHSTLGIRCNLPEPGYISLSVYDLSGRLVENLEAGSKPAGEWNTVWTPDQKIPGGWYMIVLDVFGERLVRRTVLLP